MTRRSQEIPHSRRHAVIPPRGFAVFTEADFNPTPGVPPSFALNSWGESLYLFSGDAATNLTGYSHGLEFGPAANGVTFGRYVISTGEEQWPAQAALTLGTTNSGPRVGPVVINEILYHPAPGYDEFVELHNLSNATVPLYDPAYPDQRLEAERPRLHFSRQVTLCRRAAICCWCPIDPAVFRAKYGIAARGRRSSGLASGALQDSGERLRLERPDTPDTNGVRLHHRGRSALRRTGALAAGRRRRRPLPAAPSAAGLRQRAHQLVCLRHHARRPQRL